MTPTGRWLLPLLLVAGCHAPGRSTAPVPPSPSATPVVPSSRAPAAQGPTSTAAPRPAAGAETALRHVVDLANRGQWGALWDELVPAQQAIVSRPRYVSCQTRTASQVRVHIDSVGSVSGETVPVPGSTKPVPATVVTFTATTTLGRTAETATTTVRQFVVNGRVRWSLDGRLIQRYQTGQTCPV